MELLAGVEDRLARVLVDWFARVLIDDFIELFVDLVEENGSVEIDWESQESFSLFNFKKERILNFQTHLGDDRLSWLFV